MDKIAVELFEEIMDIQNVVFADQSRLTGFYINAAPFAGVFKDRDMRDQLVPAMVAVDMEKRLSVEGGEDFDVFVD